MSNAMWSYDGSYLALSNEHNMYIFDLETRKINLININKTYIHEIAWSTDKSLLIFMTDTNYIRDNDDEIFSYDPVSKKISKVCEGRDACLNTTEGLDLWGSRENPVVSLIKFSPSKRFYFYEDYIDAFNPKSITKGYDLMLKKEFDIFTNEY